MPSAFEEIMNEIEAKRQEVNKAHAELVRFKADLDEGFKKLQYLRLRVRKLALEGAADEKVARLIEEAVRD